MQVNKSFSGINRSVNARQTACFPFVHWHFPGRLMRVNAGKRNGVLITHKKRPFFFFCSEPFLAKLTKYSQEFSSRKHTFSSIASQWWIRANSLERIFWRFTVYYCSVRAWNITGILPFTAVLRIPTTCSLELTSGKHAFSVISLQRWIRINSCKACIFSRLPPLG